MRCQLCADNPLQTAVLNLFVTLKYRFPNLVVGSITRDSVKKALSNGITADQVCLTPPSSVVPSTFLSPFSDHQLSCNTCAPSNATKCDFILQALLLRVPCASANCPFTESFASCHCTRSNKTLGIGKESAKITRRYIFPLTR